MLVQVLLASDPTLAEDEAVCYYPDNRNRGVVYAVAFHKPCAVFSGNIMVVLAGIVKGV